MEAGITLSSQELKKLGKNMEGHPEGHKVDIYGDGSYTLPTVWWAALGGFGIWVHDWNKGEERSEDIERPPHIMELLSAKRERPPDKS